MSLASDPSSQMCLLVVSVVMDHCAAAVPNALIKHLGCYPFTHHDGDHHEQHGNHHEEEMLECRVSTSLVTSSTHHTASAAERIAFLNSARSAGRSTRLAPNRRLANRIAFSHVLSSAHRLQVYLGRQRLNVPAIKHVEGSGNKVRQNERGNQSGEKQQCGALPGRIWSRPVSPGWGPANPSDITNPGCLAGRSVRR